MFLCSADSGRTTMLNQYFKRDKIMASQVASTVFFLFVITFTWSSSVSSGPGDRARNLLEQTDIPRGLKEVPPSALACTENDKKDFVTLIANEFYLWYDEMADVDPEDFATAQAYLDALTAPLAVDKRDDGFSFLTSKKADEERYSAGAYIGFGFRYGFDAFGGFFFADVFQDGPTGKVGFSRGDEVLAIDIGNGRGYETIDELINRNVTSLELFGPSELNIERGFRVRKPTGDIVEKVIAKEELTTPPLAVAPTLLPRDGLSPVGYLNLRSFISTANSELDQAAAFFSRNNVTDLVVDLRYNGGGLLSVADRMLDLLGGLRAAGRLSFLLSFNDKQSKNNAGAYFTPLANSMEPLRIAFITTNGSASASELVINGLAPHIDVVIVGDDTYGKAVGQEPFDQDRVDLWANYGVSPTTLEKWSRCDNRTRLVTFEIVNGEGDGGYYTGLVDTGRFVFCPAADDITRGFGDPGEASLSAALGWLNLGLCNTTASSQAFGAHRRRETSRQTWDLMKQPDAPFGRSPFVQ